MFIFSELNGRRGDCNSEMIRFNDRLVQFIDWSHLYIGGSAEDAMSGFRCLETEFAVLVAIQHTANLLRPSQNIVTSTQNICLIEKNS